MKHMSTRTTYTHTRDLVAASPEQARVSDLIVAEAPAFVEGLYGTRGIRLLDGSVYILSDYDGQTCTWRATKLLARPAT